MKKMYSTINRVMERLGVQLDGNGSDFVANMPNSELDISAIIRSVQSPKQDVHR